MLRFPLLLLVLAISACSSAQPARTLAGDAWCTESGRWSGRGQDRACEVREVVLTRDALRADAAPNGGFEVQAWDRPDILVRVKIEARASSPDRAAALVAGSALETGATVRVDAPQTRRGESVSASYEIYVPRRTDLDLSTVNGGVSLAGVRGHVRLATVNGGVELDDVGGDVRGRTTNGGIQVRLAGSAWEGSGLDVETTNGGLDIVVPDAYSAEFEARTTNGGVDTGGLPLERTCARGPSQYVPCIGGGVAGTLGRGGATVRAVTTNGGVSLQRQ